MDNLWRTMLGQVQPLKPDCVDVYVNDVMGVFLPRRQIDFSDMEHCHQAFEFIVPFNRASPFRVGRETLNPEPGRLFPVNPEQSHRTLDDSTDHHFMALFLERNFLDDLAKSVYGVSRATFNNQCFSFNAELEQLLKSFMNESRFRQAGHEFIGQSIAVQVGVQLLRRHDGGCPTQPIEIPSPGKKAVNLAVEFIHENYNRSFSLREVAGAAYLSPYHFSRVFRAETGKSPFAYLIDVKIAKAKMLLRDENNTVTQICFDCGFNNASHFSRIFTAKVGVAPTTYRRLVRN